MPVGIRRSLAALVALPLLAGCAQTVGGTGVPGSVTPTTSAANTDHFPSTGPSGTIPSTAVPSTPGATSGGGSTNTAGGLAVENTAGHFAVTMPSRPKETSQPGSFGGYSYTVYVDSVQQPYVAIVEGEVVQPALPADQVKVALRTAVTTFESASNMTSKSESSTTYQGRPALSAVLTRAGADYQLLVIGYSGNQTYLLFAPKGDKFDGLLASFRHI